MSDIIRHATSRGRFYETPLGLFPSVTTVLSSVPNPSLDAWRQSVGNEKADQISRMASNRGTRLHAYCESVLLTGQGTKLDLIDKASFKGIDSILSEIKPIAVEKFVYSGDLKVAGAFDLFGKFRSKLCILDFKTSRREKFQGEFDSYWIQTSAYATMLYDLYGIKVEDLCVVMQLDGETNVFWEKTENWIGEFRKIRNQFTYDEEELWHEIKQNQ